MQIPLWVFITACVVFLGILFHQKYQLLLLEKFFDRTEEVLIKYIEKFGKLSEIIDE